VLVTDLEESIEISVTDDGQRLDSTRAPVGSGRRAGEKLRADAVQPRHEAVDDDRHRDGGEDERAQDRPGTTARNGSSKSWPPSSSLRRS
jgi:hypothetical protein